MGGDRAPIARAALTALLQADWLRRAERPRCHRTYLPPIHRADSTQAGGRSAMTTQAPVRVPRQIVELAARTLPASHRERYRREFNAELHFVPRADQLRYATRVLTWAWSLRLALTEPAPDAIGESTMKKVSTRPLSCRLNLRHQWRRYFTEDGARYLACAKCGKELPPPSIWPISEDGTCSFDRADGQPVTQQPVGRGEDDEDRDGSHDGECHEPGPVDAECGDLLGK